MTDLTIGGETFKVAIEGDETLPVLLLCHPLAGDLHIWDAQVAAFSKHFRLVRYDARGHGGSTSAGAPYAITRLGLDALSILDALEVEKAHVLGVSMGGAVAQWLMIHAPHRVERVVLANTAATFGAPASWNERITVAQNEGMQALCESTIARWFGDAFVANNEAVIEPIRRTFVATSVEGYAASCAVLRDLDLREGLRSTTHQVLVIAGRDDPSISAAQTELLADTIPGATLVLLETRHISSIEDAAGFAKAAVSFLTARASARRPPARKTGLPVARRPAGRRTAATRGPSPARTAPAKAKVPAPAAKSKKAHATKAKATAAVSAAKTPADRKSSTKRAAKITKVPAAKKPVKTSSARARLAKAAGPPRSAPKAARLKGAQPKTALAKGRKGVGGSAPKAAARLAKRTKTPAATRTPAKAATLKKTALVKPSKTAAVAAARPAARAPVKIKPGKPAAKTAAKPATGTARRRKA